MRQQLYEVEKERFYLNDPCRYSICGVLPQEDTIEAWLDGVRLEASLEEKIARSAMERFQDGELIGGHRVEVLVTLPENLDGYKKLEVFAVFEGKKESWFRINVKELQKRRGRPKPAS